MPIPPESFPRSTGPSENAPEASPPKLLLSAKATRKDGAPLTEAEIEAAEEDALAWARRANSC